MNKNHAKLCPSPAWAEYLQNEVLAAVAGDQDLGDELIEVGPGPGASTDWLRHRVRRLVAVELERETADHLPTAALQNRLLSEVLRVLRPGGVLVGSDSLHSVELHEFHEGDVYNPIDPGMFLTRLQTLGYRRITISVDHAMTFVAHKPS